MRGCRDAAEEVPSHVLVPLGLPFALLPLGLVRAAHEVAPHLGLAEHGVTADFVGPELEDCTAVLDQVLLVTAWKK